MSLIENLQWRHAVKAFDPNQSVSQENIDKSHSTCTHLIGIATL